MERHPLSGGPARGSVWIAQASRGEKSRFEVWLFKGAEWQFPP
jgi:hypothetical protein